MPVVSWRHTVETSRVLRALALAGAGAIGAVPVIAATLALWIVGSALLAGDWNRLAVLLAVGVGVAALVARRLLVHAALLSNQREGVLGLPPRELAAASLVAAAVVVALAWLDAPFSVLLGLLAAAVFGCFPAVAALSGHGRIDTDDGVFETGERTVPLNAIDRVARYDLGPVTVLRVHYHASADVATHPRLLGVARDDAARVRSALEAGAGEPPAESRNPLVRRVLAAFALAGFAAAAALGYVAATGALVPDGRVILGYAAVVAGAGGALFAWLAAVEG